MIILAVAGMIWYQYSATEDDKRLNTTWFKADEEWNETIISNDEKIIKKLEHLEEALERVENNHQTVKSMKTKIERLERITVRLVNLDIGTLRQEHQNIKDMAILMCKERN